MDSFDKRLGMGREITRRDFVGGVSMVIGTSILPACTRTREPEGPIMHYPPGETGLRGSHPGSFEVAHATVDGAQWAAEKLDEHYDLVVVGAGISGLAAAYIHHRDVNPNAHILILDNHDDFGGHAKRNEFELDGRLFLSYGGTTFMESTDTYPEVAKQVVKELGIDTGRHSEVWHDDFFDPYGPGNVTWFDKETFGADYLARGQYGFADSLDGAPLSEEAKEQLMQLFADETDYLDGMTTDERREVLETHSWSEYLEKYAGMGDEVLKFVQKMPEAAWAIGADAYPAWLAWRNGNPGFAGMDIGYDTTPYDESAFYFPDGNASVARLLVRKLVPTVAPGNTMDDIVTAKFDYSQLDQPENLARIRLSSTAVRLQHQAGNLDGDVDVTYIDGNKGHIVTASKVIWAGYHSMLPYVCPDVPKTQLAEAAKAARSPLLSAKALIRNWHSMANLGIRSAWCPGSFYQVVRFTHPVSMGEYKFSTSPDEPVVLHFWHNPLAPGLPAADQFRAGRRQMLETSFEMYERNLRDQLARMLGPGGFDPARDIAAITVNRHPHGYSYSYDPETNDVAWWDEYWRHEGKPWIDARQRVGNIAFGAPDPPPHPKTPTAIDHAHPAVND
ncbi:MAG: NAD(P)-binding protein, partial [Pseudomonadota bacterium]|nr:NAD(P)-binding protein [Pseudomonadota bacterium]